VAFLNRRRNAWSRGSSRDRLRVTFAIGLSHATLAAAMRQIGARAEADHAGQADPDAVATPRRAGLESSRRRDINVDAVDRPQSTPLEAALAGATRDIGEETDMATSATTAAPLQRADELLREMTLEEKAMQLASVVPLALLGTDGPMRGQLEGLLGQGIGHIAGIGLLGHKLPDEIAKSVNAIQRYLVTETRLKIPAIFHNEALNGVVAAGFTAFPTPIARRRRGIPTRCRRWPR
jgi:hypothetical protein